MKIKDFAEEKQLTRQAIYKAISRSGFSARSLTDRSGNLTKKGLSVLNRLFSSDPAELDQPVQPEQPEQINQVDQEQEKKIQELINQVESLEQKCKEWESRYFVLVDQAKNEAEQLRILLAKEQELRMIAENKGFFRRLFAGKSKSHVE